MNQKYDILFYLHDIVKFYKLFSKPINFSTRAALAAILIILKKELHFRPEFFIPSIVTTKLYLVEKSIQAFDSLKMI